MELLVIAESGLGEYGGFFGQVIFCEHFQFFPHIIIYKTRQLHEKAGHATPCRHLEPKSLPASMKNKAKEKGARLTGLSQVSYFNLPSKSNEWHRETKRRPHLQHHVGPGVLPSPGLSSQLDKQQQDGNNAWQLNLGTKETLNHLRDFWNLNQIGYTEMKSILFQKGQGQGFIDGQRSLRAKLGMVWTC